MNLLIDLDELKAELSAIEAESIGWIALGKDAYLHVGKPDEEEGAITVTGIPDSSTLGLNVLLLV